MILRFEFACGEQLCRLIGNEDRNIYRACCEIYQTVSAMFLANSSILHCKLLPKRFYKVSAGGPAAQALEYRTSIFLTCLRREAP